jgi:membrane protein DedA with SNARE-associated domain
MIEWLEDFTSHALHIISEGDAQDMAAVFLIASLGEMGVPFPMVLDTLLLLLGYQITSLWLKIIITMLLLIFARETGAALVYWFSHKLGNPFIRWLRKKFPLLPTRLSGLASHLHIRAFIGLALSRLTNYAPKTAPVSSLGPSAPVTIAMARLTPGLLTATSVVSGVIGLPYRHFAMGTAIASIIDDSATIILGVVTGYGLRTLNVTTSSPWFILLGVIVDIIILLALQRLIWRKNSKKSVSTSDT